MTDHTKASTLSPAAFAIVKAAHQAHYASRPGIAAALRAAADQVVPEAAVAVGDEHDEARLDQWLRIRWRLLAIAAEPEGINA